MAPEIIKGESLTSRECSAAADGEIFHILSARFVFRIEHIAH